MSKPSDATRNERRRRQREREKQQHQGSNQDINIHFPTSPDISPEELIARRIEDFNRKQDYEESRKEIIVNVKIDGPIGIVHLGDPHVDDDGCDWNALLRDIEVIENTPGMMAANIGDSTNNWVGRLARLYGQQSTSSQEAWILAEWLFKKLRSKWLYLVAGNHDCWSGDGDPLRWVTGGIGALYESSEVRLRLVFPNGRTVVVNARHDFSGGSIYNPAHGPMKAGQFGIRDDIVICGHKHKSGYGILKDPDSGKLIHCIQTASYKIYDRFAREKGFRDQNISPCVCTVIDPGATEATDVVQVFWNAKRGAGYLTYLRSIR